MGARAPFHNGERWPDSPTEAIEVSEDMDAPAVDTAGHIRRLLREPTTRMLTPGTGWERAITKGPDPATGGLREKPITDSNQPSLDRNPTDRNLLDRSVMAVRRAMAGQQRPEAGRAQVTAIGAAPIAHRVKTFGGAIPGGIPLEASAATVLRGIPVSTRIWAVPILVADTPRRVLASEGVSATVTRREVATVIRAAVTQAENTITDAHH